MFAISSLRKDRPKIETDKLRCDNCGRFCSYDTGAKTWNIYPDSAYTKETNETLCRKCQK